MDAMAKISPDPIVRDFPGIVPGSREYDAKRILMADRIGTELFLGMPGSRFRVAVEEYRKNGDIEAAVSLLHGGRRNPPECK